MTKFLNITGKLSLTPSQALEFFDFKMKKGAKGIIFYTRNGKKCMRNWLPAPKYTRSDAQLNTINIWTKLSNIGKQHLKDIIRPIWGKHAFENKYCSGFNMFMSLNLKRIIPSTNWKKLLISIGELKPPDVRYQRIQLGRIGVSPVQQIKFKVFRACDSQLGIGILDPNTLQFIHIPPQKYTNPITLTIPNTITNPIIYLYFKKGNLYSNSRTTIPKKITKTE